MTMTVTADDAGAEAPAPSLADQVATAIVGIGTVGHAHRVLQSTWIATLSGNRITVNGEVVATFVSVNGLSWWQIYALDGTNPVLIVGARP